MMIGRFYLFAVMVEMNSESGIFLLEPIQSAREVGCFNTFGFNGKGDNRLRHEHGCLSTRINSLLIRDERRKSIYH